MKAKFQILIIVVHASILFGCSENEYLDPAIETVSLKSAPGATSICPEKHFNLLNENSVSIGDLLVSNNETVLSVKFVPNDGFSINEVQLWVGTDVNRVPMNPKRIPLPGKFPYKARGMQEYSFQIQLSEIYPIPEMLLEGKTLFLFAHAKISNNNTGEKISVWSEGSSFRTLRWGTYSEFTCCHPGGAGCFPHTAFGGTPMNDGIYFDNTITNQQNMIADNGEIIGIIYNINGIIYFDFDQDWMFLGEGTEVTVTGYTDINTSGDLLYSGEPSFQPKNPPYFISVSPYNYYKIELSVQFCTTQ